MANKNRYDNHFRYAAYYDASTAKNTAALDPELASSNRDGLMSKEDKAKLDSIIVAQDGSTSKVVYAADVVTDESHRFVTDVEKTAWNLKADNVLVTSTKAGLMSAEDKAKLDKLSEEGSGFNGPINASDVVTDSSHRFVTDEQIAKWEALENRIPTGARLEGSIMTFFNENNPDTVLFTFDLAEYVTFEELVEE